MPIEARKTGFRPRLIFNLELEIAEMMLNQQKISKNC
jgi:hypothetical protein